ncbi:MAG: cysteine hydrolase [Lachnospiraceae bacterium]|nr:cysteine hydrolase [Lachnospiraceae bacterium]
MKKVLVVVDMQKDFIDGALGTKEAVAIVDNVAKTIEGFDGTVIYTKDTHHKNYLSTQEGKNLPVEHCIKDSDGWQLADKIEAVRNPQDKVFEKGAFGSKDLAMYLAQENETESIEEITLMGLCTDICVISNAMLIKAFLPEVPVKVLKDCSAGVTAESHDNALEAMKMCQIAVG